MRLPAERADETIAAAAEAGITVYDTARAYEGNERLVADALRTCGADTTRPDRDQGRHGAPRRRWVPDGRAKAIRADCEASLVALDGLPIDLYLLHAPDPRTPWRTSVRALARLADEGLVRRVGLANVNRRQLDEALELAPIAAVQVALSPFDDRAAPRRDRRALRRARDRPHCPLAARRPEASGCAARGVAEVAAARRDAGEVALGWLLGLSPVVVPIPGRRGRRPRARRRGPRLDSTPAPARAAEAAPRPPRRRADAEVVLVMGIPGAGKSRIAADYVVARVHPAQPRRARRLAARTRRRARRAARRRRAPERRARQHVPDAGGRGTTWSRPRPGTGSRSGASGSTRRWHRHRSTWSSACSSASARSRRPESCASCGRSQESSRRRPRCARPASSSRRRTTRASRPSSAWPSSGLRRPAGPESSSRRGRCRSRAGKTRWLRSTGRAAPRLRLEPRRRLERAGRRVGAPRSRGLGHGPGRVVPSSGRPADLLVPAAPAGPPLAFAREHGVDPSRSVLVGSAPAHRTLAATLGARYVAV